VTLRTIIRPEAELEITEARDWYDQQSPGLGERFLTQVWSALDLIAERPEVCAVRWRQVRVCRLRRFPYLVLYRIQPEYVEVLGVVHGSRNPDVWQARG
jgi:toxin ParE1/3/4